MKVGVSTVGAAAAASHTASLAGADAIYDAAFRQLAVERAKTPEDLVNIAYACTRGRLPSSRRLAVMTMSGGAGVLMADAAEEGGLELAPLSERGTEGGYLVGAVRGGAQPGRCHGAGAERPVDPRQIVRPAVRPGEFSGDGRVLHDLGVVAANGRAAVQGGQRRRRAVSRPLFRAVGDRDAGDAAALRGGRDRPVRGPVARRRIDRRGGAGGRAAGRKAAAGPAGAGEPAAAAEGPHRRARREAHSRRSRHPGARRAAGRRCGRGRHRRAAHRRAAGAEDRLARHPAQNRDGRRHARHSGERGRRRVRPHDRAHQDARAARRDSMAS